MSLTPMFLSGYRGRASRPPLVSGELGSPLGLGELASLLRPRAGSRRRSGHGGGARPTGRGTSRTVDRESQDLEVRELTGATFSPSAANCPAVAPPRFLAMVAPLAPRICRSSLS